MVGDMDERVVLTREPLNAETPLDRQVGPITPVGRHYVRSHFSAPPPPAHIAFSGLLAAPFRITPDELRALPARTLAVTLECAGNGRSFLDPPAPGEQWRLGAVGTAEWTGVPLATLVARAAPLPAARELVFRGADAGVPNGLVREIAYERSLPVPDALGGEALLAYAMNGEPLVAEHGAPVRLVVPGSYGMASVKWLAEVTAVADPFPGFFQRDRYVIDGAPLGAIEPRAVIVEPADNAELRAGPTRVRGYAWCARDPIAGVELSTDRGTTWAAARLAEPLSPFAWREWTHEWDARPGRRILIARAVTHRGERQPLEQVVNPLGYSNTAAQPVRVSVVWRHDNRSGAGD